jgi:hypothetical protein
MDLGNSTLPQLATSLLKVGGKLKSWSSPRIFFPRSGSKNTKAPPEMESRTKPKVLQEHQVWQIKGWA